jgi:hypothetical protein
MKSFGRLALLASLFRKRRYLLSATLLMLPAFAMWIPRSWARGLYLNNNMIQAALSALVAVLLVELIVVRSAQFDLVRRIRAATIAYLIYTAVLEIGQSFVGRRPSLSDFLINAASAAIAVALFVAYRRRLAPPRPYDELRGDLSPISAPPLRTDR